GLPPGPDEKINLPMGPAPVQALASLDKDGKLVIKTLNVGFTARFGPGPGGALPPGLPPRGIGGGGAGGIGGGGAGAGPGAGAGGAPGGFGPPQAGFNPGQPRLHVQTFDLDRVQVFDSKGKRVDGKKVAELLKEETVALAAGNQPLDPLHLREIGRAHV